MISIILITSLSYLFYKIDVHNIIFNSLERKYRKWQKINNLVSSRYETSLEVYKISITMVCKAIYISLLQYINNSVKQIDKNIYEINYVIEGIFYKMIVIPKKGPHPILQIRNENHVDITDNILPYYGPCHDWHSITVIPQFFKCKTLIFDMSDGTEKTFGELEYIDLNS